MLQETRYTCTSSKEIQGPGVEREKKKRKSKSLWGFTVALLRLLLAQDYSNCWHYSSRDGSLKPKKGSFLSARLCCLFSFSSLMRWNVAKLAAERQSFIYKTIKWSFTKHTQYALDVGFVNIGWPLYALKWGGGSIWMLRAGEKCQTEIIHHHAIKRPAALWVGERSEMFVVAHWVSPLWRRECVNERVNVKKCSFY